MNKVQMGIIKKIIKDSVPEIRSVISEIDKIKRDIGDIKSSLERIEGNILPSHYEHDLSDSSRQVIEKDLEDFFLQEKINSSPKLASLKRVFSKIFNRDNTELFLSITSLVISVSVAVLVILGL